MLHIISQSKMLFMAGCISYFEGAEGNTYNPDLNRNTVVELAEFRKLMELQGETGKTERQTIVSSTEKETLFGAAELLSTLVPFNKEDKIAARSVQYVATKILKLEGKTVADGSLDTKIGKNTIADVEAATGIEVKNGKITSEHITKLAEKARTLAGEQIPEVPKSLLETMEKFEVMEFTITSKDSDGLEAVLVRNKFSRGEAKEILTAIGDKIPGFSIDKIYPGDVFTFRNPENGPLSIEFQRGEKPKQVLTLAGANYTEGEDLKSEANYTDGEKM